MKDLLLSEIIIKTSRASGPGGQHVNKTESKVELHWNFEDSLALNDQQKYWLEQRIGRRLTKEGELILISQSNRSQVRNKEEVIARFLDLVYEGIKPPKRRIATKPSKSSVEKRIKLKKALSDKKKRRRGGADLFIF